MKCINCNLELNDGEKVCKHCGTAVVTDVIRCPKCFVKLDKKIIKCPKCGCNIQKALDEEKKPREEKKKITKKHITIAFSSIGLVLVLIFAILCLSYSSKFNGFKKDAISYLASLDENMEEINMLAEKYNEIYDGQWLIHTERAAALEVEFEEEITELKENRDKLRYYTNTLANKTVNDDDKRLVKKVFKDYDNCYTYVVGKNGKYPGYMTSYKKILKTYEKDFKALKNRIK